jgi:hypothetical protein
MNRKPHASVDVRFDDGGRSGTSRIVGTVFIMANYPIPKAKKTDGKRRPSNRNNRITSSA